VITICESYVNGRFCELLGYDLLASLPSPRARLAVFLVILSAAAMIAPAQAQTQFTLSTDRSAYNAGETVRITIQPTIPAIGVSYWLMITKPDSSQTRIDLVSGQGTATLVASVPVGQDKVELWGQVSGTGTPQLFATVSFTVNSQFTISTDKSAYNVGETVTVTIRPTPAIGVDYWLMITKPDSSQKRINLSSGQGTATFVAELPSGQDKVELWGQVSGTGTPQLFATVSFTVNSQFTISTDKALYLVGENVTVTIQPAPAVGVSYWLNITKPDGSHNRIDLSSGQGKATLLAAAPVGQDKVELWGQVPGTSTPPRLYATGSFTVASSNIPGFPIESLLAGIAVGVFLTVAGRRFRSRHPR
jgi:ribosomal protein L21E